MKRDDSPQSELVFQEMVFVHIPKNGGSTFIMELNPRYTLHSSISHLKSLVPPETPAITTVRNPRERLHSNLRFTHRPFHPDHELLAGRPMGRVSFIVAANHFSFLRPLLGAIGLKLSHPGWRSQRSFLWGAHKMTTLPLDGLSSHIQKVKMVHDEGEAEEIKKRKDTSDVSVDTLPKWIGAIYFLDWLIWHKAKRSPSIERWVVLPPSLEDLLRYFYQLIMNRKRPTRDWDLLSRQQQQQPSD